MTIPIASPSLVWSGIGAAAKRVLADLVGRIVSGIKCMTPVVFAFGCQTDATEPLRAPPRTHEVSKASASEPALEQDGRDPSNSAMRPLGKFNITFYYVVGEEEMVARRSAARKRRPANENRPVTKPSEVAASDETILAATAEATPAEKFTLHHYKTCEPIAESTREFAREATMQGTGKLRDGRVVNVTGPCSCPSSPCWRVVTGQHWGTAGTGRSLQPFRTVAVDPKVVKLGSLLYVPLLEGRTMPGRSPWGGYVHDGCVVADDTGGAVRGKQLDLFVGRRGWFLGMSGQPGAHSWARHVPVFDGSKICERKGRRVGRKTAAI